LAGVLKRGRNVCRFKIREVIEDLVRAVPSREQIKKI